MKRAQKKTDLDKLKKLQVILNELEEKNEKIRAKREKENPYKIKLSKNNNVKFLILIMIICAFTGLLTPTGDTPYTYLYKTMQGNTTENISEHLPMTLANSTETMCMIVIFLAILIFTKTKIKLSDLFMVAGLCYLMLSTRRQLSMFVLICSVVLTRLIVDLINRYTKFTAIAISRIRIEIFLFCVSGKSTFNTIVNIVRTSKRYNGIIKFLFSTAISIKL